MREGGRARVGDWRVIGRTGPPALVPLAALGVLAIIGCFDSTSPASTGAARCDRPVQIPDAVGCAIVYGTVMSTRGQPLDSIEGSVRVADACRCTSPLLRVDDRGVFSVTIHRTAAPGSTLPPDTASATLVVLASAPKYPRHVTGAPYFDTLRVLVRFAPTGQAPVPLEVALRIPLP